MYYTDGSGSISAISFDGTRRNSPLNRLKQYFPDVSTNVSSTGKGGAGSGGPAIFGGGFGFAASNSNATGATSVGMDGK